MADVPQSKIDSACSLVLSGVSATGDVNASCRAAKTKYGDFMLWLRGNGYEFLLAEARSAYADKCMRELVEIADAPVAVVQSDDEAKMRAMTRSEEFRVRNRMDARKFVIDKMVPDKASTRINISNVQDNRSIRMTPLSRAFDEREKG